MGEFYTKDYSMSARESIDELHVGKAHGSDWSEIKMITNKEINGRITIRSKEMAEQLRFMLGQMLSDG